MLIGNRFPVAVMETGQGIDPEMDCLHQLQAAGFRLPSSAYARSAAKTYHARKIFFREVGDGG